MLDVTHDMSPPPLEDEADAPEEAPSSSVTWEPSPKPSIQEVHWILHNDKRSPAARKEDAKGFFSRAFEQAERAGESDDRYRSVVALRLVRLHLGLRGKLSFDDPIEEVDATDWEGTLVKPKKPSLRPSELTRARGILQFLDMGPTSLEAPADPKGLARWRQLHVMLIEHLRIGRWAKGAEFSHVSSGALARLIDEPSTYWPRRETLVVLEEEMIDIAVDDVIRFTQYKAMQTVIDRYGYDKDSAAGIVKVALARLNRLFGNIDFEAARALMLMRLEEYRERAKASHNLQAEMYALKAIAIVQGFGKAEPDDSIADLTATMKRVTMQGRPPSRPAIDVEVLPASRRLPG